MTTDVTTVAELLSGFGSGWSPVTDAVLLMEPAVCGVTTIVMVAPEPASSEPTLQTTGLLPLQVPCVDAAETNTVAFGSVSVTWTPVATAGPWFVAVIV
jgi:hypothetical protein